MVIYIFVLLFKFVHAENLVLRNSPTLTSSKTLAESVFDDTTTMKQTTINLNWPTRPNILTGGHIHNSNSTSGHISLTGRHASQRNKKIKTPHRTKKMNFYGYPHCTHLAAAPPTKPTQSSHQKSAIFANALFGAGFRATSNFQDLNRDLYHLKLLLCEL